MREGAEVEYVLPLRRFDRREEDGLVRYLAWLVLRVDVTVVDGSAPALFEALASRVAPAVRHVRPDAVGLNGKACGVLTGVRMSRHETIIVADDDVRYGDRTLHAVVDRLREADFVRPQNVYTAYPWWARWDTARSLIGRALGGDFGGTVGLRRSALERAGGYSPDVLFENLELERTIALAGGRVVVARDVLVPRIPPTLSHFFGQRVRQAYDDFAQPARLAIEAALLPAALVLVSSRSWRALAALAAAAVLAAEAGRRASGGAGTVPASSALWAPLWALERAVAVWIAVVYRLRGGVPYAGGRIFAAATPVSLLRERVAGSGGAA